MVAPLRVSERTIHNFVKSQQNWVITAKDKIEKKQQTIKKLAPEQYKDGASIPFRGEQRKIQLNFYTENKIKIESEKQLIKLYLPKELEQENADQLIRQVLVDWMKKQAAKQVKKSIDIYAEKYKLYPRYVRIKTQKSRWGSCGIHNDVNLNWLLILTPPKVMEYVVIHELCHIQERNHSADFWRLVERHCPDYKQHRLWLKQNGRSVMQGL